jgi:hypothetical protein
MSRLRLFQIRLAVSAALLLLVFTLIGSLWYPGAYFTISGVSRQLWVLVGVVAVVGPVLSTFVYKPGKKGLVLDLVILAAVELAVLVAASVLIFQGRPYFTVFAVDRFEAVALGEVSGSDVPEALLGRRPDQQQRLVYAELPEDPERMSKLINETVVLGMADIDRRPEFWKPYAEGIATIKAAARPLQALLGRDDRRSVTVNKWLLKSGGSAQDYIVLPLRGGAGDGIIILHADNGYPVATLAVDPW